MTNVEQPKELFNEKFIDVLVTLMKTTDDIIKKNEDYFEDDVYIEGMRIYRGITNNGRYEYPVKESLKRLPKCSCSNNVEMDKLCKPNSFSFKKCPMRVYAAAYWLDNNELDNKEVLNGFSDVEMDLFKNEVIEKYKDSIDMLEFF